MTRNEIFGVIKTQIYHVASHLRGQEIREGDNLTDLGVDSLDVVEVVSGSMKQLGVKVPRTRLQMADELPELIDIFAQAVATKEQ